jgi:hypothetical protein
MILGSLLVIFILFRHINDLKNKSKLKLESLDQNFLFSIILNICATFGGAIGFGRPYCPAIIYLIGVVFIACAHRLLVGYVEWVEKLFVILSILSLSIEYFYFCIQNNLKTNRIRKLFFLVGLFVLLFLIFLFIYYHAYGFF